jgi:two-component system nitrate/nitrite response regulator NarL
VSNTTPTIIVANSALWRKGMSSLLQGTRFKVTNAVGSPGELANHKLKDQVLAILGIDWRNRIYDQAGESIRLLRTLMPESKIVLVAEANAPVDLRGLLAPAPDGYILNPGSRDLLVRSLELILMGQQIFVLSRPIGGPANAGNDMLANGGNDIQFPERAFGSQSASFYEFGKKTNGIQLSHRERQVLISLAHGESNKGIARAYDISEATVKIHLKAILRKTKMRNRTQAAIWAIEHGLADARPCDLQPLPSGTVGGAEGKSATDKTAAARALDGHRASPLNASDAAKTTGGSSRPLPADRQQVVAADFSKPRT